MAFLTFEWKKMSKEQLKAAVSAVVAGVGPGFTGSGGGLVRMALGTVETGINAEIDHWLAQVTINDNPVTAQEVSMYLAGFAAVPQASKDFVAANPEVLRKLTGRDRHGKLYFTHEQQQAILGNVDWLALLMEVMPIILKLLMLFI